jgi:hypothetical protein
MKKVYINPNTKLESFDIEVVLQTTSLVEFGEGQKDGSLAASRDFNIWEGEVEEDEDF